MNYCTNGSVATSHLPPLQGQSGSVRVCLFLSVIKNHVSVCFFFRNSFVITLIQSQQNWDGMIKGHRLRGTAETVCNCPNKTFVHEGFIVEQHVRSFLVFFTMFYVLSKTKNNEQILAVELNLCPFLYAYLCTNSPANTGCLVSDQWCDCRMCLAGYWGRPCSASHVWWKTRTLWMKPHAFLTSGLMEVSGSKFSGLYVFIFLSAGQKVFCIFIVHVYNHQNRDMLKHDVRIYFQYWFQHLNLIFSAGVSHLISMRTKKCN